MTKILLIDLGKQQEKLTIHKGYAWKRDYLLGVRD